MTIAQTRDEIVHCARRGEADETLREHLERATGLSIAELAEVTKRWPT